MYIPIGCQSWLCVLDRQTHVHDGNSCVHVGQEIHAGIKISRLSSCNTSIASLGTGQFLSRRYMSR